jgi:hypothetical protein
MADKYLSESTIQAGATSVSAYVHLRDTTSHADATGVASGSVTASYWRQGGLRTAITVSALGSVNAAYASGGWIEVDATNMPGVYRFDLPDAALATGADWVVVSIKETGSITWTQWIALSTFAPIADKIEAQVIETEGSYTVGQALSVLLAVLAGVTSNSGATIKTPNGAATRVVATVNASNERTAMTLTPSA